MVSTFIAVGIIVVWFGGGLVLARLAGWGLK